jgi:hypothetical protein
MNVLPYAARPPASSPWYASMAIVVLVDVMLIGATDTVIAAAVRHGLGPAAARIYAGPVASGLLALLLVAATPRLKRWTGAAADPHVWVSVAGCLGSAIVLTVTAWSYR